VSGAVVRGQKGILLSRDATLGIDCGGMEPNQIELHIDMGGKTFSILPQFGDRPETSVRLADHATLTGDPQVLRGELRLRGSARALVRFRAWIWPGLRALQNESLFVSDQKPANFKQDLSQFIALDASGRLCLDPDAAYETAKLVFEIDGERVDFEVPRPGLAVTLIDSDGRPKPITLGETIIVRDEDRGGFLTVRCPDRNAVLNVRGRLEPDAFRSTRTRILALSDLIQPAPQDDVSIERSHYSGVPLQLARIQPAMSPKRFAITRRAEIFEILLEMQSDIDAVRFSLESESGEREEFECAVGYQPVSRPAPPWLNVQRDHRDATRHILKIDLKGFSSELCLAEFQVRPAGQNNFRPLTNLRGDTYALALKEPGPTDFEELVNRPDARKRFEILTRWMQICFAPESWDQVSQFLPARWNSLGSLLLARPGGREFLLSCAHMSSPSGAARSWVPLAHPLQINADLYGGPAISFHAVASRGEEGSDHLAILAATHHRRLREMTAAPALSPAFFASFRNFREAQNSDVPLADFSFDRYQQAFHSMDTRPGARWFWQISDELLGPAHYGAAMGRFSDRLYDAGLEEAGSNDARIAAATTLARRAERLKAKVPQLRDGVDQSHAILEWAPALFSGFAEASRRGHVAQYLDRLEAELERSRATILGDIAFLIRLGPELLAFFLLLWELVTRKPNA